MVLGSAGVPPAMGQTFEGPYPARILTIESGRLLPGGDGIVGLGDTRVALAPGGRRIEILSNTIADVIGVLNAGVKVAIVDARGKGDRPAVAIGGKYYHSVGGPIDAGVERIAESFATVTSADVDVRGWVAHATATWPLGNDRTHAHVSAQLHHPLQSRFSVQDTVAGGRGSVTFIDGDDFSTMAGIDHALIDTRLLLLAEAGMSWGLGEPRLGVGIDAGSTHWRVAVGILYPGVETDLATDSRDFYVTPVFSLHRRF